MDGRKRSGLRRFEAANIPNYKTESAAVYGFMHLVRYRQARDLLMATPPSMPTDFVPDVAAVRPVIDGVLREKRTWLDPVELTAVLSAYSIPITPAVLARDPDEAVAAARPHPGQGRPGRSQNPIAGYRAQIGSRRRAA